MFDLGIPEDVKLFGESLIDAKLVNIIDDAEVIEKTQLRLFSKSMIQGV